MLDVLILAAVILGAPVSAGAITKYERDHGSEMGPIMIVFISLICLALVLPAAAFGIIRATLRKVRP